MLSTIRRLTVAAMAIGLLMTATPAQAEHGWTRHHAGWVPYSFTFHNPHHLKGAPLAALYASQRDAALTQARKDHDAYAERLRRLLARARAILATARTVVAPSSGVWACVARWEEGGVNTASHGFFGFMFSPPSGGSWLAYGWSAQVAIAEGIRARYGWGAWGPHTREMCGLG